VPFGNNQSSSISNFNLLYSPLMSKNSSYSRYSTSFKLAVNLGIADQTDISSLPSSTRHNFRNTNFTDIVGKEYEGLTQRLDQVKEILDSRTATAVAHSVATGSILHEAPGKGCSSLKETESHLISARLLSSW
jgi:hypothetical protein